jgi:hypothetical protein
MKLTYEALSEKLDPLYALNLAKEEFGPRFVSILRAAGWSERAFWAEENARARAKSTANEVH